MSYSLVHFRSGPLLIEGALYSPNAGAADSVVVICHPHPQSGGDMHNNVVVAIARAVQEQGLTALTFNFRGVGASEGAYDGGAGEVDDARGAIAYALSLEGVQKVGLAGYSFGAGVATGVLDDTIGATVLVAPPSRRLEGASTLAEYAGPLLLMAGELDHIASGEALKATAMARSAPTQVVVVPGVDHFWRGAEDRLATAIGPFFRRWMEPSASAGK